MRRLHYVAFVVGLFRIRVACADVIWHLHLMKKRSGEGKGCVLQRVLQLRPKDAIKFSSVKCPQFKLIHDAIYHDSQVSFYDAWRIAAKARDAMNATLENFAKSESTWQELTHIFVQMADHFFASLSREGIRSAFHFPSSKYFSRRSICSALHETCPEDAVRWAELMCRMSPEPSTGLQAQRQGCKRPK